MQKLFAVAQRQLFNFYFLLRASRQRKTPTLGGGFLYNYYLVIKIFCIKFIFIDINMVTSVDTSYGAT
jgi:hypothetical protein